MPMYQAGGKEQQVCNAVARASRPGKSGNPAGRQAGVPNKVTIEMKAFAQSLFAEPKYQARVRRQCIDGTLAPQIETLLLLVGRVDGPGAVQRGAR